jgi:hypothetical protein
MRYLLTLYVAVLLLGALATLSCQLPKAPERPSTVPQEATWVGGEKGGCWIKCQLDASKNANRCTVFDERTGDVWASGLYVLRSDGSPVQPGDLDYNFFNGRVIGLSGGRILVPRDDAVEQNRNSDNGQDGQGSCCRSAQANRAFGRRGPPRATARSGTTQPKGRLASVRQ